MSEQVAFWRCIECGEIVLARDHESHEHNEFKLTPRISRRKKQELLQAIR